MHIYIAGKITGLDENAAKLKFHNAALMIARKGHIPLDPIESVDQDPDRAWEDCMIDGIEILICSATAIYMLPDWQASRGARIEHAIARELGYQIFYAETDLPRGME